MRRSKTWSLVVASVTLVSVLGACSAEDADDGPDGGSTQESSPTAASAGDSETTDESDVTGGGDVADDSEATATADDELAAGEDDEVDEEEFQVTAEGATPREGVAAEITPDEVVVEESADEIIAPVVAVQSQVLEAPREVDWDSVVSVADEGLLSDIEVSVLEYGELGWSQVGSPELVSSLVQDLDEEADPPSARVEVCLDHSQVDVVDSEGVSVLSDTDNTRVRSVLTLVYVDGRWVAVSQEFADELYC